MDDGLYPIPWARIEAMLKLYGGWSRMFARSREAIDEEIVVCREGDPGFWETYAQALADEQFRAEVEQTIKEFRQTYPEIRMPKKELREKLARALLQQGWKPVKKPILEEVRRLRREKREAISALKEGIKCRKERRKR